MNNNIPKINYWAVIVATFVAFVASSVWYTVFGNQYMELRGIGPNDAAAMSMSVWKIFAEIGRILILACVLAHLVVRGKVIDRKGALKLGIWLWIGFPVVLLAGSVIHDNVPWMLAAIHAGDWLVKLLLMTVILGVWAGKKEKQNA